MAKNENTCDCNVVHHDLVAQVTAHMPGQPLFACLSDFYKIMGDRTRCRILYVLSRQELCVCDLANVLSMTKSSISHQLSKMREYGVVKCRREGKSVYYSLDDAHVAQILQVSMTHIQHKLEGASR